MFVPVIVNLRAAGGSGARGSDKGAIPIDCRPASAKPPASVGDLLPAKASQNSFAFMDRCRSLSRSIAAICASYSVLRSSYSRIFSFCLRTSHFVPLAAARVLSSTYSVSIAIAGRVVFRHIARSLHYGRPSTRKTSLRVSIRVASAQLTNTFPESFSHGPRSDFFGSVTS